MASSNPFRRSVAQPRAADSALPHLDPIDTTETYAPPPRTSFRDAEPSDADEEAVPEPEHKKKPAKKVRVLTPPPLSPDSPEWPETEPMYRTGAGLVPPPVAYDPFAGSATDESDRDSTATPPYPNVAAVAFASAPPQAPAGPPGNPFSRTLHDMENGPSKEELDLQQKEEGEALKAANAGAPTLNVDAFRRLLLTGNSGMQGSGASVDDQMLASYNAQANKIVPALSGTQDQSQRNSNIQQDQQAVSPSSKDKKLAPPPPPSSRHGKTIRGGQPRPARSESERQSMSPETESTLNSHLPSGNGVGFTSDESSSADSQPNEVAPSGTKKAAPAPPPRRGHARTDTKSSINSAAPLKPNEDDYETRSSIDSTHRQERAQVPAPPPPRRPHAMPKQGGAAAAPSPAVSSSSIPQRGQAEEAPPSPSLKPGKSPAPPRPPSRNPSSARRLPGGGGGGGSSAPSTEKRDGLPPPPPPRRSRGSSSPTRKSSSEMADAASVDPSKGADILADLDALRREVEALRSAR